MKILLILLLIVPATLFAQDANALIEQGWSMFGGIAAQGFVPWIKSNWIIFAGFLIGIFSIIATRTPNDADNKVAKFLTTVVNFLGMNIGKAKNDPQA